MYNILVVDDSALMRKVICDIISSDESFHVADVSADGEDAYNKIKNESYDLVLLDMVLPKLTAVQLLQKLGDEHVSCNVVLMSSSLKEDAEGTLKAMELGALDFVLKPLRSTPESRLEFANTLLKALHVVANACRGSRKSLHLIQSSTHAMSHGATSSVSSTARPMRQESTAHLPNQSAAKPPAVGTTIKGKKIVALACSTGGPQALLTFVPMLPASLKYPVVIVQHIPVGFSASLANRLDQVSAIHVKEAEEGEFFEPGCVYITPGGKHMEIRENSNHSSYCHLNDDPPIGSLKPCADVMYRSLISSSCEEIICVVLTGMGADGSEGIRDLSAKKKTYVISQDASTCVVYGMPKAVATKGLSNEVVPLKDVANSIVKKMGGL